NLKDSFCKVQNGEIMVLGLHISPYSKADQNKVNPLRERKLLLNKRELVKLVGKVSEKGLTLIPLKVYFDGNWAKIDVGLAKPKKTFEKRETLKARAVKKEIDQVFKGKGYDRKD
ncbi:MAG: SsrA-binding protein, partial [Candidatus Margulisiibacteriota bacterium]